jgi:hypothetical protein
MGPPIKRPSVKENASPGEETIIGAVLRYGRVEYSLCQSLFVAFAGTGKGPKLFVMGTS